MSFLLLRPQAKCQASASAFINAGLNAVACGLIDTVVDQQAIAELPQKIATLKANSSHTILVIVTSTVAAEQCAALKEQWPSSCQFFAVGQSTANILEKADIKACVPSEPRTEGLLALTNLQNVHDQSIVIMKGYGGRELLSDTLISRGARVQEWEVYKRQTLSKPISTQDWHAEQIHCIIATSGEVIASAFRYFDRDWLIQHPWIVVSQRTADIASDLGVKQIKISCNASDQALIQCAHTLASARHSSEL